MSEPFSESDPFEILVDEYLDRYRRGERPSLTEFAAAHPEHAVRLRSLVPAMLVMEEFGPGSDVSAPFGRSESLARMPERLGDYRLIRPIGSGGMGVVYEAIQESLGRHVALKTIPSHQPEDATRLERFRHEAHAAARLHHAHIVPVFGIGEHDGLHFYTMQFIQGHGLDLILREVCRLGREPSAGDVANGAPGGRDLSNGLARDLRDGRFLPQSPAGGASASEPRAPLLTARSTRSGEHHPTEARYLHSVASIGVQVADALEYAHRQGVLHRDIKPSNLLLDAQGHVWVTDFGLAKTQDRDELTRTGDVVGTLRYMAPERFSGWSDPRSDIFALGATLYELLTFRPAFDEPDRVRLVDRLLHGSPPPLRQLDRRFPRDLETIVLKALANTSGERYATAGLLAEDLRRFVAGRPIVARRSHVIERVWRWSRRNPAGAAAAATVAATLTAAVAMSIIYAREQRWAALEVQALAVDLAKERQSLQASLTESRRILALRDFDRAQAAFEKDQGGSGLLWLMESWRYALGARDPAWQHLARANLSAWSVRLPRLTGLLSHEDPIDAAVFSPDGTTILTGSDDFSARFWSADTSQPIGPTLHHPATVYAVALSPDGKTALTGCGDGVARLWDAASGRLAAPPLLHADRVASVAFSPDGKTVLTGSNDGTARLWNATTGLPIGRPLAYGGPITAVAFNPVGNLVAAASRDGTILFWNAADGTLMHFPLMRAGPVLALAFAPNGLTIFTAMEGGSAQIWGVTTGRPIVTELNRHRGHVRSVAVSPDGRTYVTGSEDKTARLWDASTHQPLGPPLIHQGPVVAVAFRADGKSLLTASSDHTVRVWDAESCRHPQPTLERAGAGRAVAFRPDSESFVGANWDGTTRLWNIAAGLPAGPVMHSQSLVLGIACSPDGKTLVAGGVPARLWDIATGRPLGRHLAHPGGARVVAFSPKGDIVVTGGADQTIRIWDGETGAPLSAPTSHTGEIDAVAFSPNGKTLVAGYDSGNARIWDVTALRPIGPVLRHSGAVSAVGFSPDGETIATGCEDGMARLWDVRTGDLRVPPLPHQAWVFAVAFSPDGKTVLTGSRDRTARLWDAAVGQPIGPPFSHNTEVWAVAFAPDGQSILTGDISSTARVFALPSALPDDPEQVGAWIELLTGLRLDATRGSLLTVDNTTWRATRDRLKRLAAEPRIGAGARLDIRGVPPSTGVAGKAAP